jgi:hypothetical protein
MITYSSWCSYDYRDRDALNMHTLTILLLVTITFSNPKVTSAGLSIELSLSHSRLVVENVTDLSSVRHEDIRRRDGLAVYILRLGTRRWWRVDFTSWHFTPEEKSSEIYSTGGWVAGLRTHLEVWNRRKPPWVCRKSNHYSRSSNPDQSLDINLKLTTILSVHIILYTFR